MSTQRPIHHVKDGEDVRAGVAGRPTRELESVFRDLAGRMDAAELGDAVTVRDQLCAASVVVGMAVYWNDLTGQFEPALARHALDANGLLRADPSCLVVGVAARKRAATAVDVVVAGRVAVDLVDVVGADPVPPGPYYLSATEPGGLTRQTPPIAVPVLVAIDGGFAFVQPGWRTFLEDHVHHRFELVAAPAGSYNAPESGPAAITGPDAGIPGWLPVGFPGTPTRIPTGAQFVYNMARDPGHLGRSWPPSPIQNACLFVDRGDGTGGHLVPPSVAEINVDGIWWKSACVGELPWPETISLSPPPSPTDCPIGHGMRLDLFFGQMTFSNSRSVVTSLSLADPEQPLTLTDCNGDDATTGDLFVGLGLAFQVLPDMTTGATVLTGLDGYNFTQGIVTEGLIAGANALLTSTQPLSLAGGGTLHRGRVTVDFLPNQGDIELEPHILRLGRAQERFYRDWFSFSFPAGRQTDLWLYYAVPPGGLPTSPRFKLRLVVAGVVNGTVPTLAADRRLLARPSGGAQLIPAATSAVALTIPAGATLVANQAIELETDSFAVTPGSAIVVKVERSASDGYADELLFLRMGGLVFGGS